MVNLIVFNRFTNIICQIFTVQKYRFGNIISTPHEMCVLELNTIEIVPTKHDVEMKTSTRTIIAITVIDKWIWVNRDESEVGDVDGELLIQ